MKPTNETHLECLCDDKPNVSMHSLSNGCESTWSPGGSGSIGNKETNAFAFYCKTGDGNCKGMADGYNFYKDSPSNAKPLSPTTSPISATSSTLTTTSTSTT